MHVQYSLLVLVSLIDVHLLLLKFSGVNGHLKDMGEVIHDWKAISSEVRIVGGEKADLKVFPFMVQFFNFGGICAGSILTSKTVLTAAHCFDFNTNVAEMRVFSKARFIFDPQADHHEVWEYVVNEQYNHSEMFSNDIALILVHDSFNFGLTVQRALIVNNIDWMDESETSFLATGWGKTQHKGETSKVGLMKANLRFIPHEKCERMSKILVPPGTFCLYGDQKRDTCQGDSGGGIIWHDFLVGIVSHGHGCGKTPSMYVDVYYYKHWIFSTIQELNKQFCRFHRNL